MYLDFVGHKVYNIPDGFLQFPKFDIFPPTIYFHISPVVSSISFSSEGILLYSNVEQVLHFLPLLRSLNVCIFSILHLQVIFSDWLVIWDIIL